MNPELGPKHRNCLVDLLPPEMSVPKRIDPVFDQAKLSRRIVDPPGRSVCSEKVTHLRNGIDGACRVDERRLGVEPYEARRRKDPIEANPGCTIEPKLIE